MTAPVAPMEARCEHCLDTGSLSKQMDGTLDCHYCDATDKRLAMRDHLAQFTGWPQNDVTAWAAYLFAQRQAAPVAQPAQQVEAVGWAQHDPSMAFENAMREEGFDDSDLRKAISEGCTYSWIGTENAYKAFKHGLSSALQTCGQIDAPFRVAEFWSSANPKQKVLMLVVNEAEAQAWQKRSDFIRWVSLEAQQAGDVALKAARYDWLRHADLDALQAQFYPNAEVPEGEEFDRIIDAAMAKEKA